MKDRFAPVQFVPVHMDTARRGALPKRFKRVCEPDKGSFAWMMCCASGKSGGER